MKKIKILFLGLMAMGILFMTTGCYFWEAVEEHQFALLSSDGVTIDSIVGAGRYTDNGFRAEIFIIDAQAQVLTWNDSELLTADRQSVGVEVSLTYARDVNHALLMWTQHRAAAQDDAILAELVLSRVPRIVRAVTTSMTLDDMLGREVIQAQLREMLSAEFASIGLRLIDVGVNNIRPTQQHLQLLEQRATIAAEEELAIRRNEIALAEIGRQQTIAQGNIALAEQQLELERAETEIALELARREQLIAMEENKVFELSSEALQIRLAEIQADALRGTNTIYLPSDVMLNIFDGGVILPNR